MASSLNKCYEDVRNNPWAHPRGEPLTHWYYLLSVGNSFLNIKSFGQKKMIEYLLDAINQIGTEVDYHRLKNQTLMLVAKEFGRCSHEYFSFVRAWNQVCVPAGEPICDYWISGNSWACEESNYLKLCLDVWNAGINNYDESQMIWTIIGPLAGDYESVRGMTGPYQYGGNCLQITSIPKYPYYPRHITVELRFPTANGVKVLKKRITILDCHKDDPTCDDYHAFAGQESQDQTFSILTKTEEKYSNDLDHFIKVFDLSGKQIMSYYNHERPGVKLDNLLHSGLYFMQIFDERLNFLRTEKLVVLR